jgi:uncharacterized protein YebE (UPF0316 family)
VKDLARTETQAELNTHIGIITHIRGERKLLVAYICMNSLTKGYKHNALVK